MKIKRWRIKICGIHIFKDIFFLWTVNVYLSISYWSYECIGALNMTGKLVFLCNLSCKFFFLVGF